MALKPALATAAPAYPPNSACDELVGSPKYHVIRFQMIAPMSPARITENVTTSRSTIPEPDRLGDGGAEEERRDEVEERGPGDRLARREHARGDDGGNRIGGVVKAVDEIENQRRRR